MRVTVTARVSIEWEEKVKLVTTMGALGVKFFATLKPGISMPRSRRGAPNCWPAKVPAAASACVS